MSLGKGKTLPLHKILYPLMVVAMIAPVITSSVQPVVANAKSRRPRSSRRMHLHRRGRRVHLVYAGYQRNPRRQRKQGYGKYTIRQVSVYLQQIPKRNRKMILHNWQASRGNLNKLKQLVNKTNRSLKHSKRVPSNTQYLVPSHNAMMVGSVSSKAGADQNDHHALVPIKIKSRTTLWDIARANLKHYHYHTYKKDTNRAATALLKMNRSHIKGIHQILRRGTQLVVPTHQAKTLKTSFTPWMEFTAGLSKSEIHYKRWIAKTESTFRYHVWAHGRVPGKGTPYGKYQLEAKYLHYTHSHADNDHAWNSPYTQEDMANQYAFHRYGNWANAVKFHKRHGWY